MSVGLDSVIHRTDQFIETEVDGEVVLMNHVTGTFFSMTGTSMSVWRLTKDGSTLSGIVAALCQTYDVEPDQCLEDTMPMIELLRDRGILAIA